MSQTMEKMKENRNKQDTDEEKKRKRDISSLSSQSELDTSDIQVKDNKDTKQDKKKKKNAGSTEKATVNASQIEISFLQAELKSINKKLEQVSSRDDNSLKEMIKEIVQGMKSDIVKSFERRMDILEGSLHEKQIENDELKETVMEMSQKLNNEKESNAQLKVDIENQKKVFDLKLNDLEQYGRRNNIRIDGLPDKDKEKPEETIELVKETLNKNLTGLNLSNEDFDIAHRLGRYSSGNKRQVIVKLKSRMAKLRVITRKKELKGKTIYINEDLTRLNLQVLAAVRVKQRDVVKSTWTKDGSIFFKDTEEQIHEVKPNRFEYWLSLAWPATTTNL